MDIPIKFKFFDKLKLYQDYLKESCMHEKTKMPYWLYEKAFMLWGYSEAHQHLGKPLDIRILTEEERAAIILKNAEKIGKNNYGAIGWVKKNMTNEDAARQVIRNLIALELATRDTNHPEGVTINLKGFLLGELLFETYEKQGFWSKNFRKYKFALFAFYTAFAILFLTIFLVFIGQLIQLVGAKNLIAISDYIQRSLGCSWWATITICFLIYLGLRRIWEKL